jgi:hypothetical protein
MRTKHRSDETLDVTIRAHELSFTLSNVDDEARALFRLRLNAFLMPRGRELLHHIHRQVGTPLPASLEIRLTGTTRLVHPMHWHKYVLADETNGRHVLEIALVHVVARAMTTQSDYRTWHAIGCGAIKDVVDPNYICALDRLW